MDQKVNGMGGFTHMNGVYFHGQQKGPIGIYIYIPDVMDAIWGLDVTFFYFFCVSGVKTLCGTWIF